MCVIRFVTGAPWGTTPATVGSKTDCIYIVVGASVLMDHLIRLEQDRRRDCQPEGLGGLEVDHQFQLRGELDRQITRRRAMQDFVHICSGAMTAPAQINAVTR